MGVKDLRGWLYRVLAGDMDWQVSRAVNRLLAGLILLNVAAVILETVEPMGRRFRAEFAQFEAFSVTAFTVEYLLRLWTCVQNPKYRRAWRGRVRFLVTPLALLDLLAILPAYLPGDPFLDLRFARIVRLVRMSRVLKAARYSRALQVLGRVYAQRHPDIGLIFLLLSLLLVVAGSSMYFVEHPAQPQVFSSIPAAMWWAVTTLTTVGYGDIYPITPLGKLLGACIALIGIGFFALPAGMLAAGYAEELSKLRRKSERCPHCGKSLGEPKSPLE